MRTQTEHEKSGCTDYLQHNAENCPNMAAPAQAQHSPLAIGEGPTEKSAGYSPLPWTALANSIVTVGIPGKGAIATLRETPCVGGLHLSPEIAEANAAFIVRACNNAQRLADALKPVLRHYSLCGFGATPEANEAREALAQWENK